MPGDPWLGCEGWQSLKQLTGQRKAGHTEGLRFFKHEVLERVVFFLPNCMQAYCTLPQALCPVPCRVPL